MLHHRIVGKGKPVLVLHGVALDHRYMMDVMEPAFRATGSWKRIYVDMPGHGLSPSHDWIRSQDDLLKAVVEFVDKALPTMPFGIAGLSRGSYLARGIVHVNAQAGNRCGTHRSRRQSIVRSRQTAAHAGA